jgi:hypothetical protein
MGAHDPSARRRLVVLLLQQGAIGASVSAADEPASQSKPADDAADGRAASDGDAEAANPAQHRAA